MIYWGAADDVYWAAVVVYGAVLAWLYAGAPVPDDPCADGSCGSPSR